MNSKEFAEVFEAQVKRCNETLFAKASEYATDDDRMHNFDVAAKLSATTPIKALGGMMIKHTVSVYDMISADGEFVEDLWDEKITDHINYLILLKALVRESKLENDPQARLTLFGDQK